jgi:Ca2+-binding EF-hand superfamily protein
VELVEFKRQVESLGRKIEEATRNQLQLEKWGRSVFVQFDTDGNGKLSPKELAKALSSLPRTVRSRRTFRQGQSSCLWRRR